MEHAIQLGIFERAAIQKERAIADRQRGRSNPRGSSQHAPKKGRVIRIRGTLTISIQ